MTLAEPSAASASPLARLQRLARSRPAAAVTRCELCGAALAGEHSHLLETASRQLSCACEPCAILFSERGQRYLRVHRRLERLPSLDDADELWDNLHIPIKLAFFYRSAAAGKVIAMYPSPAGATESLLPLNAWDDLVAAAPPLAAMAPDVEALLLHHFGSRHHSFLVSIDRCYELVGIIRSQWRGLSGGSQVWAALDAFFAELHRRTAPRTGGASRA